MSARFEPTIGHLLFGAPHGEFDMPEHARALFEWLCGEIGRVVGNRDQAEWSIYDDPQIPGIEWRPYFWGDDDAEAAKPNFVFEGVEIRWYKYPGRGMSTNVSLSPAEWAAWFDACVAAVRAGEARGSEGGE